MSADDILEIRCPKCDGIHAYILDIRRSFIFANPPPGARSKRQTTYRSFRRLFTCPKRNEDFQALFVLFQDSDARIESVDVKGLVTNGQEKP